MENNIVKRKFNSKYRKKLVSNIKKIKDKKVYIKIFNIVYKDIG